METTEFIWLNGSLQKWEEAKVHVLTHSLHYGAGVFEGIRAYKTERGAAIFRLQEHVDRLFYSARSLKMEVPYTESELFDAIVETVSKNKLGQGYIRPLIFLGYGKMGLNPIGCPVEACIACWPWGSYLPHDSVDIKISSYIRIHPKSTISDAKICGHYVNSIFAVLDLEGTDYHEALLLDFEGNIAEGPGENFFIVKDGKLKTPPLGNILAGITRNTVIELATEKGLEISEETISPETAFAADEAFFTGTAAEITPINSIDGKVIGKGGVGDITKEILESYEKLVRGKLAQYEKYLTYC